MEFNEEMKVSLEGMGRLPTLPGIAVKILELVKNVNSNINDISDIISSDPPLRQCYAKGLYAAGAFLS